MIRTALIASSICLFGFSSNFAQAAPSAFDAKLPRLIETCERLRLPKSHVRLAQKKSRADFARIRTERHRLAALFSTDEGLTFLESKLSLEHDEFNRICLIEAISESPSPKAVALLKSQFFADSFLVTAAAHQALDTMERRLRALPAPQAAALRD